MKKNFTRWTVHREEKFLIGDTLSGRWIISISPVEGGWWIDWGRSINRENYRFYRDLTKEEVVNGGKVINIRRIRNFIERDVERFDCEI